MRVVLDHCTPKPFGFLLTGHFVRTASFMGWDQLENGKLLAAAAREFEVIVTTDRRMEFEQHAADLPFPVIALYAPTNRMQDLALLAPETLTLLANPLEKRIYRVYSPGRTPPPTP